MLCNVDSLLSCTFPASMSNRHSLGFFFAFVCQWRCREQTVERFDGRKKGEPVSKSSAIYRSLNSIQFIIRSYLLSKCDCWGWSKIHESLPVKNNINPARYTSRCISHDQSECTHSFHSSGYNETRHSIARAGHRHAKTFAYNFTILLQAPELIHKSSHTMHSYKCKWT